MTVLVIFVLIISVCDLPKNLVAGKILDLNRNNFQEVAANTPFLLVEFYAPWCPYCKDFAPEYQKADSMLQSQNSPVKLAKVDASAETDLAEENGVRGYPTIKFYNNGYSTEYDGSRSASDLVEWLNSRSQ